MFIPSPRTFTHRAKTEDIFFDPEYRFPDMGPGTGLKRLESMVRTVMICSHGWIWAERAVLVPHCCAVLCFVVLCCCVVLFRACLYAEQNSHPTSALYSNLSVSVLSLGCTYP
jgi:hypothetical protein